MSMMPNWILNISHTQWFVLRIYFPLLFSLIKLAAGGNWAQRMPTPNAIESIRFYAWKRWEIFQTISHKCPSAQFILCVSLSINSILYEMRARKNDDPYSHLRSYHSFEGFLCFSVFVVFSFGKFIYLLLPLAKQNEITLFLSHRPVPFRWWNGKFIYSRANNLTDMFCSAGSFLSLSLALSTGCFCAPCIPAVAWRIFNLKPNDKWA